jgi:hypothetical protein
MESCGKGWGPICSLRTKGLLRAAGGAQKGLLRVVRLRRHENGGQASQGCAPDLGCAMVSTCTAGKPAEASPIEMSAPAGTGRPDGTTLQDRVPSPTLFFPLSSL